MTLIVDDLRRAGLKQTSQRERFSTQAPPALVRSAHFNPSCYNKTEGYDAVKVLAAPVEQLLKPGLVLAARLALSDQRRVGGEDDALLHAAVVFRGDLAILELGKTNVAVESSPDTESGHLITLPNKEKCVGGGGGE